MLQTTLSWGRPVRVGVNILNFGPGARPVAFLEWARLAEGLGYASVMISDHVAITPSVLPRYPEPFYDTFTSLAWLAGQISRVQLGTTVAVLPYRHPVLTARIVANIDQFSEGRFILGVGVGNAEDEFKVLGQPHGRRGLLANESLGAMLALWTGSGPVSFHGRIVNFDDVSSIETHRKPHPPIWVGGRSSAAFRRTVRFGDAWHPILRSLDSLEETDLPGLRSLAEQEGKPMPAFCPRIRLDVRTEPIAAERWPGTGSLEQIHADFRVLERLGAEHVILDWNTGDVDATADHQRGWGMLRQLAEKVLDLQAGTVR
jgi:probable F420-dependent oxidoreductase